MKKCHFIFDKVKKNLKLKKIFLKENKNYPVKLSNVIIANNSSVVIIQLM